MSRSLAPSSIATPPEMVAIPKAMPDIKRVNGNPLDCVTSMVRKIAATPASMKGILIMVRQMVFFIYIHIYDNRLIVMYPRRPVLNGAAGTCESAALAWSAALTTLVGRVLAVAARLTVALFGLGGVLLALADPLRVCDVTADGVARETGGGHGTDDAGRRLG